MRQRIIAAMPFISLLLFLASGFILEEWLLGLSFFLLIPLSIVLLTGNFVRKLNQAMPLITVLVFLWLAIGLDLAHPGWVVFFAIPITDMLLNGRLNAKKMVTLSITVIYLVIGFVFNLWHPGWLIFLLIPIVNTLFFPSKNNVIFMNKSDIKRHINNFVFDVKNESDDDIEIL